MRQLIKWYILSEISKTLFDYTNIWIRMLFEKNDVMNRHDYAKSEYT